MAAWSTSAIRTDWVDVRVVSEENRLVPRAGDGSLRGMGSARTVRWFKTSPEIIRLAIMKGARCPLSSWNVEDLLHERGIGSGISTRSS